MATKKTTKKAVVEEAVLETAAAEVKKTSAKKATAKRTAVKEEVVLQFADKEVSTSDIMKNVKEIWTKVLKNKVGDMKTVSIYLKPEESAAYYVVNGDITGKIEL